MKQRLAPNPRMVAKDRHTMPTTRRSMRGLQRGDARAYNNDMLGRCHLIRVPVMLVGAAHPRVVVTLQARAVDDAAPTGIARNAITNIRFPTLLTLFGERRIRNQRTSEKHQIGGAIGQRRFTFIRIRDVTNGARRNLRGHLPKRRNVMQVGMPLAVGVWQVFIQ